MLGGGLKAQCIQMKMNDVRMHKHTMYMHVQQPNQ